MKLQIPSFIPLSPTAIAHLEALDYVTTEEELKLEISRYNLNQEKTLSDATAPIFDTEEERLAYKEAERRVENAIRSYQKTLDFSDLPELSALPTMILKLTDLVRLDLENTKVVHIAPLANLRKLRSLYLENTPVTDISALAKISTLTHLNLIGSKVTDVSALRRLNVSISINPEYLEETPE